MARDVYMNRRQQTMFYAGARDIRLVGSRRFGKTDGTIGPQCGRVVQSMPQGAGIWCGNSRKQLLCRTVPATLAAIERFYGYREGVHFWWGQPPKKLDIPRPIIKPKDWSNCISFYNGWVWHLISLEVRGSANSLTVNYIVVDEARFIKKEKLDAEVMPTLSGITHPMADPRFSENNPYYKGTLFASDAALSQRENWMEKEEDKMDIMIERGPCKGMTMRDVQAQLDEYAGSVMRYNELLRNAKKAGRSVMVVEESEIARIQCLADKVHTKEGPFRICNKPVVNEQTVRTLVNYKVIPVEDAELLLNWEYLISKEDYLEMQMIRESKSFKKHINTLRCNAFAFYRTTTLDNVDLLGIDYIEKMKRDLPPIVFAISILNLKKQHSNDGFYSRLDIENVHGYVAEMPESTIAAHMHLKIASTVLGGQTINTDYATPDFSELQNIKDCTLDGDCKPDDDLYVAMDYNANINWIVTGQVRDDEMGRETLYTISSMYTKNERKLRELCEDWCRYYAPHRKVNNTVHYFYDSTAKYRGYAIEGQQDFKDVVIEVMTKYGWNVDGIDIGRPPEHELKHKDINECLAELAMPICRFNKENNEALLLAMENAEVEVGYRGFRKNKAGEKLAETEADQLQWRTDGTDAWDILFWGVKYWRSNMCGVCLPRIGY